MSEPICQCGHTLWMHRYFKTDELVNACEDLPCRCECFTDSRIRELETKLAELEEYKKESEWLDELQRNAYLRAQAEWRERTGKALVSPDLADLCVWVVEEWEQAKHHLSTLEAQLAEAKRDSERLDAVEQNSWTVARWRKTEYCTGGEYTITPETRMVLGGWGMLYTDNDVAELPTIREAIDAAIKAKETQ